MYTELPNPDAESIALAQRFRQNGALLKEIAHEFNLKGLTKVSRWCKGLKIDKIQQNAKKAEAFKMETHGIQRHVIAKTLEIPYPTLSRYLKVTCTPKKLQKICSTNPLNCKFSATISENDVTLQENILNVLSADKKETREIVSAISGFSDRHIQREIKNLVAAGKIQKLQHGVYAKKSSE